MTFLQKLQKQKLSPLESIINNLLLILNTYCSNINNPNAFGINFFHLQEEELRYMLEKEEKRIEIINIDLAEMNIDFIFNNQVFSIQDFHHEK